MIKKVLVVEDEKLLCNTIKLVLNSAFEDLLVECVFSLEDAEEYLKNNDPVLILLDYWMKGRSVPSLGLLEFMKIRFRPIPKLIVLSADLTILDLAQKSGLEFIPKPFELDLFLAKVTHALTGESKVSS